MGTRTGLQLLPGRGAAVVGFYSKHIYTVATQRRKGNPEQNAYMSLMVWFKAAI
jgi:hypothetical protein